MRTGLTENCPAKTGAARKLATTAEAISGGNRVFRFLSARDGLIGLPAHGQFQEVAVRYLEHTPGSDGAEAGVHVRTGGHYTSQRDRGQESIGTAVDRKPRRVVGRWADFDDSAGRTDDRDHGAVRAGHVANMAEGGCGLRRRRFRTLERDLDSERRARLPRAYGSSGHRCRENRGSEAGSESQHGQNVTMSVRSCVVGPHEAAAHCPAWPAGIVPETA